MARKGKFLLPDKGLEHRISVSILVIISFILFSSAVALNYRLNNIQIPPTQEDNQQSFGISPNVHDKKNSLTVTPTQIPTSSKTNNKIIGEGVFSMDGYNVSFSVTFFENGGHLTGIGKGDCTGTISGGFNAETEETSGTLEGSCLYNEGSLNGQGIFRGNIYVDLGYGSGAWEGNASNLIHKNGDWRISF